jgi:hypothetical protein
MAGIFISLQWLKEGCLNALTSRLTRWTKPLETSLPLSTLTDLSRSKSELLAEIAFLRQQLIILGTLCEERAARVSRSSADSA